MRDEILGAWLDPRHWLIVALTAYVCVLTWVLVHQMSPPVIEACGKVVAPAFDRNAKP